MIVEEEEGSASREPRRRDRDKQFVSEIQGFLTASKQASLPPDLASNLDVSPWKAGVDRASQHRVTKPHRQWLGVGTSHINQASSQCIADRSAAGIP